MKKVLALLLAMALVLLLTACGDNSKKDDASAKNESSTKAGDVTESSEESDSKAILLGIGDVIKTDLFKMTIDSVDIKSEFSFDTGKFSKHSLYVEDGYKLLMLRGNFENLGTSAINESSFILTATVNDTFTVDDVNMCFMRSDSFEIDPYTDVDYCIYINIPNKLADRYEKSKFTISFKNDLSIITTTYNMDGTTTYDTDITYEISTDTAKGKANENTADSSKASKETSAQSQAKKIVLKEKIVTDDYELTFNNVELTYEVKPQNTSSVYSSYKADSGKVFIHLDGEYYNKSKTDVCIRDLPIATADYDNGYTYNGFAIADKGDNSFDWVSSYIVCKPLDTCHYHCLIECPKKVDDSDAPLFFTIELAGTEYRYDIR